jgi:hypothetical protein
MKLKKKIEEFLKNIKERKVRKRNRQSELEFLWPNFVNRAPAGLSMADE